MVPGRRHIALIDGYLKLLSWTQQELAKQADISAPQLHGILNQDRPLTRGILAAIAWAIAEGVDELKTDDEDAGRRRAKSLGVGFYGRRELEVLLAELLKSAGFSSKGRPERNLVWDRVGELEQALQRVDSTGAVTKPTEHPKLRVGWFDWAPINALDHDEGVPLTLWQDIVECVCGTPSS